MQPGPELDRAVAEALGFEVCDSGCWMPDEFVDLLVSGGEIKTIRHFDRSKAGWSLLSRVPFFSTNANDALAAAEHFGLSPAHIICLAILNRRRLTSTPSNTTSPSAFHPPAHAPESTGTSTAAPPAAPVPQH